MSPPSVTEPIARAFERTRRILFAPFDVGKWFVIGFCAFLAYLGEGNSGGCNYGNWNTGGPGPNLSGNWLQSNWGWITGIGIVVIVVALLLGALLTWLRSRGKFMFLDCVARNRGAVRAPWKHYRAHGNSLFVFSFVAALLWVLTGGMLLIGCAALAWGDIQAGQFGEGAMLAILLGLIIGIPLWLGGMLFFLVLDDFAIPLMYLHGHPAVGAIERSWTAVIRPNLGLVLLFYGMRIVLGIGIAVISGFAVCATCLLAAIPYLGTVILLPLFVFSRCYVLEFVRQFGPEWDVFGQDPAGTLCQTCGYDLSMNLSGYCPECGSVIPLDQRELIAGRFQPTDMNNAGETPG